MYKKILVCLDNSEYSTAGIDIALEAASSSGGSVTGCHVYAARLHDMRFRQMEGGLPPQYQTPGELKRQREVHDGLITRGLKVISDSYMAVLVARASSRGIETHSVQREGRNYVEILKEVAEGGYDLVVMGAMGLGGTDAGRLGSVAERVARGIAGGKTDVLVVRDRDFKATPFGRVCVGVDGSRRSFGALKAALALSQIFSTGVEAISAFDPDFHYTAFRSIAGVLTEEAGKIFRFNEQEKLHSEIIDNGLKKIYEDHLKTAGLLAEGSGGRIDRTLLSGKPADRIIGHVKEVSPFLLVLGRTGVHSEYLGDGDAGPETGSVAENSLREAGCNVLLTGREASPPEEKVRGGPRLKWTKEAEAILGRIPPFARGVARNIIEEAARKEGISEITEGYMRKVRDRMEL
jgi:nucleotide-binding universal stress UspA family protein